MELSFRHPETWPRLPYKDVTEARRVSVLLGDEEVGPLLVFAWFPPVDHPIATGTPHGHESDNWRITLLGESHMGTATYRAGQFRFQQGGKPYGRDDYAAGPDGGYHLVMFGDRRGFRTQPVKKELEALIKAQDDRAAKALGIVDVEQYPPLARGLATTIGTPDKAGKVEGSFADAGTWPEVRPGVRVAAGAFGDRSAGPVVLLVHAEAGQTAVAASQLPVEVLVMVIAGRCDIGGASYGLGDIRLFEANAACPPMRAGTDGLDLFVLVADRRGLVAGSTGRSGWDESLEGVVLGVIRDVQQLPV